MSNKKHVAVLVSGVGSNLQAMLDAKVPVSLVISDRLALGWELARKNKIATCLITTNTYNIREDYDQALISTLKAYNIDLVVLAGFMRILGPTIVKEFKHKMINIHPSLLPKYRGLKTHQRVLDAKDDRHGCTVHWVTEKLDAGPIIRQSSVPVLFDDDKQTLAKRVKRAEQRLYPTVIKDILQGKIKPQ